MRIPQTVTLLFYGKKIQTLLSEQIPGMYCISWSLHAMRWTSRSAAPRDTFYSPTLHCLIGNFYPAIFIYAQQLITPVSWNVCFSSHLVFSPIEYSELQIHRCYCKG